MFSDWIMTGKSLTLSLYGCTGALPGFGIMLRSPAPQICQILIIERMIGRLEFIKKDNYMYVRLCLTLCEHG